MVLIKKHLRVDHDDEDDLIKGYAESSVDYVENYCDGSLVTELTPAAEDKEPPREVLFSPGIWQAMLLLIGHYYATCGVGTTTPPLPEEFQPDFPRPLRDWHSSDR